MICKIKKKRALANPYRGFYKLLFYRINLVRLKDMRTDINANDK